MRENRGEKGFTYVEVVVCLCIVVLIIEPFSDAFLSSIQTKRAADDLMQATDYGEKLLVQIKEKMARDIVLKQQIEGNLMDLSCLSVEEKEQAPNGMGQYLCSMSEIGSERRDAYSLNKWLNQSLSELQRDYATDRYAYEIAIWRIEDVPMLGDTFYLTNDALQSATKFYTDKAFLFQLSPEEEKDQQQVTYKIADDKLALLQEHSFSYEGKAKEAIPCSTILFHEDGTFEEAHAQTNSMAAPIQVSLLSEVKDIYGNRCGYHFIIEEKGFHSIGSYEKASIYSIEMDVRKWLRNEKLEEITSFDDYTFKFTNQTPYDIVIDIKHNLYYTKGKESVETEKNKKKAIDKVNQKFRVISENQSTGKVSVMRREAPKRNLNYMIVMQVRDKVPNQGKKGKVVKKMLDFYSFDVGNQY